MPSRKKIINPCSSRTRQRHSNIKIRATSRARGTELKAKAFWPFWWVPVVEGTLLLLLLLDADCRLADGKTATSSVFCVSIWPDPHMTGTPTLGTPLTTTKMSAYHDLR